MELGGEIFETPDEPEDAVVAIDNLSKPAPALDKDDAIDQSRVPAGQAFERFVGASCEVALEDFSDTIDSPGGSRGTGRKGRAANSSSSLPLGARFERLCKEAELLFQDIDAAARVKEGMAETTPQGDDAPSTASPPPSVSASLRDEALALQARLLEMRALALGGRAARRGGLAAPPQGGLASQPGGLAQQASQQVQRGSGGAELASTEHARISQGMPAVDKDGSSAVDATSGERNQSRADGGTVPVGGGGMVAAVAGEPAAAAAAALASTWQLQVALGRQLARHVDSIWEVAGAVPPGGPASADEAQEGAEDAEASHGQPRQTHPRDLPPTPPILSYELYCLPPGRGEHAEALQGGASWQTLGGVNPTAKMLELDQRVAALERLVGVGGAPTGPAAPPGGRDLTRWVSDLARRVSLMDAADVEMLERRLQLLTVRMKSLTEQKKMAGGAPSSSMISSSHEAKIKEMFSMMERWDPVARQLPAVVLRLHALAGVHAAAARFQGTLASLEEEQGVLAGVLDDKRRLLEEVAKNVASNVSAMAESMQVLERRFSDINGKLQALK
eukprot:jgi/Mesvir1/7542/Mv19287-RA.2